MLEKIIGFKTKGLYFGELKQVISYNIEGNNYFKLRDITDALDCRVEWDESTRMIWVIPARTAYDDPDEIVG